MSRGSQLALVAMLLAGAAHAGTPSTEGGRLYADNCAACHLATGKGIAGAFPALERSKFVTGDADALAKTLLEGRGGMPSFKASLDDNQLAVIASYIRSSWGNRGKAVSPGRFAKMRSSGSTGEKRQQVH